MTALESIQPCELPGSNPRVEAALADWRKEGREIVTRAMEKGEMVLDGVCRLVAFNVYDAFWDGKYAVISAFIGYIEGMELLQTDEELFAQMKVLNGDFVAELDGNLRLSRVWRQ